MAKINQAPSVNSATDVSIGSLSTANRRTLQGLRRSVLDTARSFGAVRERCEVLAPKIVRLFNAAVADNERLTFVAFARMFDPTVPTHAADRDEKTPGYRNHRVYYTLQYMRRLVVQAPRGQQGVRNSATDALARTLATILQVIAEPEAVWTAIQQEFQFGERLMTRLRKRVADTQPLVKLAAPKPIKAGDTIHMPHTAPAPAGEPMAQAGRRVDLEVQPRKKAA